MKKYALLSMIIFLCLSGSGTNSSELQDANKSTADDVHKIQYKVDSTTTNGNMTVDASYEEFDFERLKTF